ncbi:hypothetical protein WA026_015351 [Henosepilachna vigintioctopunctata]|uniref:Uncharacterized protein n=1 Tax=Henosepilachna vigintioctopunctata TaxID=420089 RepID=A0AAW1UP71_9CUCU
MDKNMELLWAKLENKLNHQTLTITTAVTTNVMEAINDKMDLIIQENKKLQTQIMKLEQKLDQMEIYERKKNLVFFELMKKQLNDLGPEKRKREQIGSPNSPAHKRSNPNKTRISSATNTKDAIKPDLLNYVARGRSSSLSELPKND